jgi:hypothetical protein
MVSNTFKTLNSAQPYLSPLVSSAHKKKLNIARIKKEANSISCLESYKKQRDKDLKAERDNWILFRGLRSEKELTIAAKKLCSDQKIACIIENMYIKSGLDLTYPT